MIGRCARPRRQQDFLLPSMPQREDEDDNCFRFGAKVCGAWLHSLNLDEGGRSQAKPAVAQIVFVVVVVFVFFFGSGGVRSGVEAGFSQEGPVL